MANGNLTPEETQAILSGGNPADEFPTQEPKEIDNLIKRNDFFWLLKGITSVSLGSLFRPEEEQLSAWEALTRQEEDPMTPPQATASNQWKGTAGPEVPFSEYMQHRNEYMPWLNQRYRDKQDIRSILEEHTNDLTKKK